MKDIVFLSATQLATAIRVGHLSATEVLEAHLAQIATCNSTLNAVVTMDAERAYERAREADAVLARGEIWGRSMAYPLRSKTPMQQRACAPPPGPRSFPTVYRRSIAP